MGCCQLPNKELHKSLQVGLQTPQDSGPTAQVLGKSNRVVVARLVQGFLSRLPKVGTWIWVDVCWCSFFCFGDHRAVIFQLSGFCGKGRRQQCQRVQGLKRGVYTWHKTFQNFAKFTRLISIWNSRVLLVRISGSCLLLGGANC